MILVIGAGLAGLSASYHLGHSRCVILERSARPYGHLSSTQRDGFTWDTGPHVSFTKNAYVQELFRENVDDALDEFEVTVGNYYQGHWVTHPAQTSLHQIPEPLRSACLQSFLDTRTRQDDAPHALASYQDWLDSAFGPVFAAAFPAKYTRKYWTRDPADLTTDWIGGRIHYPKPEEVVEGSKGPLPRSTHYISKVRYPRLGGYESFAAKLAQGADIRYGADVSRIDLVKRKVWLSDGRCFDYSTLINTMPLPQFILACEDVPAEVREHARQLCCTQLLLVNVAVPHTTLRPEHWIYVYDEDKLATRINFTERLSASNAPPGWSGIQAEVYSSRYRPFTQSPEAIAERVERELVEMGLVDPAKFVPGLSSHRHFQYSPWANVVFDHTTAPALESIWQWLSGHGLRREDDDLSPLSTWSDMSCAQAAPGQLYMAGRFGQWKYFWSDDCVLRGRQIATML